VARCQGGQANYFTFLGSFYIKCPIHVNANERFVDANITDTMVINKSVHSPVHILKNELAQKILKMENNVATLEELLKKLSGQLPGELWFIGGDDAAFPSGQVVGRARETLSIKTLIDKIMVETEDTRKRLLAV